MKKILALLLALSVLSLSACASTKTDTSTQDTSTEATGQTTEAETADDTATDDETEQPAETAEAKRVEPMENSEDVSQLENGIESVSFSGSDVTEEDGKYTVTLTVYTYDLYDMADLAQLAVGDTIVVDGEDMVVTSVEESDGVYTVNGGYENGGAYFATSGDTTYYVIGPDDAKTYYSIGTVTVPVSGSFVLTDNSDLDNQNQTYTATDLAEMADGNPGFQANNAQATIENGELVSLTRSYVP